jgi:amino acid adenylation domain-containing protein
LIRLADAIAARLERLGVVPGDVVAICAERSPEAVAGVLGILEAGAAYLPLDPTYPRDRLDFMLGDARPSALVTQQSLEDSVSAYGGPVLHLDRMGRPDGDALGRVGVPDDLERAAYVIYTSGSTGTPKGVVMPHRPLCNLLEWQLGEFAPPAAARTLQFASLSFDVGFQDVFSTWASGGTLVLVDEMRRRDPDELLDLLIAARLERIFLPFVALEQLAEASRRRNKVPPTLREVITAGEALHVTPAIRAFFAALPGCRLVNQYGPTESHVATAYTLVGDPAEWPELPPIGRPIANAQVELRDGAGLPVPEGEPGELWLGGVVLAHGYLHRPELTAERFVENDEGRFYRTGDLGRVRDDGEIEFSGRLDDQVKIRGYRVELGEVEAVLARDASVASAVCSVRRGGPEARLIAYVIPARTGLDTAALRAGLSRQLPPYMVPSSIVLVERFPLTPSGKIDRRALPVPTEEPVRGAGVAPRTPLERRLAAIWREILDLPEVGVTDDFFDLGATSLAAAQLFARIESELGQKLPIAPVFQAPTIESLAQLIESDPNPDRRRLSLVPVQPKGSAVPLFCVHGGAGTILHLQPLSRRLGREQPFYGLQQRGLYGDVRPQSSVVEMAASYVQELRALQPHGPYQLLGYCFGALVAFEMAKQLRAAGEDVALVGAINGPSPGYMRTRYHLKNRDGEDAQPAPLPTLPPQPFLRKLVSPRRWKSKIRWVSRQQRRRLLRWRFQAILLLRVRVSESARGAFFLHVNYWAQSAYRPEREIGTMVVFHGTGLYSDDPTLGWDELVDHVVAQELPGPHRRNRDAMHEPFVEHLAAALEPHLLGVPARAAVE